MCIMHVSAADDLGTAAAASPSGQPDSAALVAVVLVRLVALDLFLLLLWGCAAGCN
jgi:hypothetical protein